jgi:site-specific recombinase XerC
MVLLSLRYGLRCSEATGLSLGHVDLKTQQIRVERLTGSLTTVQICGTPS